MYERAALSSLYILVAVAAVPVSATCQSNGKRQDQPAAGSLVTRPGRVLKVDTKRVGDLAFSPDGRTLAIGVDGGNAQLWDVKTEKLLAILPGHRAAHVTFSGDGRTLATADSRVVRLWDTSTGKLRRVLTEHGGVGASVAFSADSRLVAASDEGRTVTVWDVVKGQSKAILVHPEDIDHVSEVALSPDGRVVATLPHPKFSYVKGSPWNTVFIWDTETAKLRTILRGHGSAVYTPTFSPDGRTLATISRDATARLWDVAAGTLKVTLLHKAKVIRLAFSPDGRTLATGSHDETAKLWDVETGKLKATLAGHKDTVWSLSFSPDSWLIATASGKTAKVWDAQTGELKQTFDGMQDPVAFSPVGRILATGSRSRSKRGTVTLWDIP